MTSQTELERLLDRWFADGPTEAADRVLDNLVDGIDRQGQRPAWRVSLRDSHVNTYFKPLLAAAAIIVIAVAGIAVINRPAGTSIRGAASSPSTSPPSRPSPSPAVREWWLNATDGPCGQGKVPDGCSGPLTAGTHTSVGFQPAATFTVPLYWVNVRDWKGYYDLFPDNPANRDALARGDDPVMDILILSSPGPSIANCGDAPADQVVATLATMDPSAASSVRPVTVGGLPGAQIDLGWEPDWSDERLCPMHPSPIELPADRHPVRVILLDTPNGYTLTIYARTQAADEFDSFLSTAMPIIESLQFDLGPEASPS
jgi:hypothetical protein